MVQNKFKVLMDQNSQKIILDGVEIRGKNLCVPIGMINLLEDENLTLLEVVLKLRDLAESELRLSRKDSLSFVIDGNDLGIAKKYLASKGKRAHFLEDVTDISLLSDLPFEWDRWLMAGYKKGSSFPGHCVLWKKAKTLNMDPLEGVLFNPLKKEPQAFHLSKQENVSKLGFLVLQEMIAC